MWWVDQAITDPISGPSFDFTFSFGPELDNNDHTTGKAERRRGILQLHGGSKKGWLPECQEVAAQEETSSRVGAETRLERLLGLSQRHNTSFLPLRLKRGK